MRHVRLLATGGTIASRRGPSGWVADVPGRTLLESARVPDDVEITVRDLPARGSFAWSVAEVLTLVGAIREELAAGCAGLVVTHGTDTMEESAFLTSLVAGGAAPVVFTGAQRPYDDPAPDGPANLADALAVAASTAARGRGPLVCFDGTVYTARGVTKVDTMASHAFAAPGRGPALRLARGEVLPLTATWRPPAVAPGLDRLPRVDVVSLYVGADGALLHAAGAAGARGVVLAAFGVGNANPDVVEAVGQLVARGIPVLVCSRVRAGSVRPVYGGGGGADLQRAGARFADDLSPWQARLLLSVALAVAPADPAAVVADYLSITPDHGP